MLTSLKESFLAFIKEKMFLLFLVCFLLGAGVSFLVVEMLKKPSLPSEGGGGETPSVSLPDVLDPGKSEDPEKSIVVDLSGAVQIPGVYKLTENSRIVDLLSIGGGVTNEASAIWISRNLNLSRVLADSEKVYIPFEWEVSEDSAQALVPFVDLVEAVHETTVSGSTVVSTSATSTSATTVSASASTKINVNTASAESLDTLPGIGAVYSQKIVSSRPYKDINDLQTRTKIAASTLDKLKDLIVF